LKKFNCIDIVDAGSVAMLVFFGSDYPKTSGQKALGAELKTCVLGFSGLEVFPLSRNFNFKSHKSPLDERFG
jgi:hypothetical protein